MGNFKRGIFLGGLLGAGLAWLSVTKEGKAMRDQAMEHGVKVYERVKRELPKTAAWKKMTKSDFAKVVQKIADDYSAEFGLAKKITNTVVALVVSQWNKLKKE
ncbi:MAG: hypothetical protein A2821_03565 [Candidatus Magasanikbacteria bacterium RIFCSPHIGHO2_01_FULL_41_23]|uniref:YtxH domain-containing protein n=1 Tax=Candidatus Magasanikbacteria bacterium RIFCSPLOWO2_01_FULL_40_15 TaxID=1798686 RepID=A0A1F6N198_9BACT|nr:MAG: hypothetical protein A2821_03565 [Candidatus Magasanikbacteria bacterium RIFCSPHIGHO2_01_FULL_41_23]OGH66627.1 MAG: hypothetical protein A3C66_03145 [Candidatus Magasanikbacteria bacterium RIFCSPHIGHO2_02_FULL_41_35]OGH74780.1 MAG: hypothetical protein A3F22_00930 [Candidatus Magasanikbacteria bacterium RIFCSPHIGHO2_12_FULL_41_16]OGH77756.1 MAG: hypothetical protein A2983_03905 [Candidatus Magasanikbacteria bacterium RIFCSPLOWO2_01_FULL_40_15]